MECEIIEELADSISNNIYLMFDIKSESTGKSSSVPCLSFSNDFMAAIPLFNKNFNGEIIIGFPKDIVEEMVSDILGLVKDKLSQKFLKLDTIGEILNVAAGRFVVSDAVKKKFSKLSFSTPVVWAKDKSNSILGGEAAGRALRIKYRNNQEVNLYLAVSAIVKVEGV